MNPSYIHFFFKESIQYLHIIGLQIYIIILYKIWLTFSKKSKGNILYMLDFFFKIMIFLEL